MAAPDAIRPESLSRGGVGFALGAYVAWGVVPIYWKQLTAFPAIERIAHRVLWTLALTAAVLALHPERARLVASALGTRRQRTFLFASGAILGVNWWTFLWAVQNDHIVDTSLGYYLTPLLNVLIGIVLYRERLSRLQGVAVGLALLGVLNLTIEFGRLPWVSLVLGVSFAIYGALRKSGGSSSLAGLVVEMAVLSAPGLLLLVGLELRGDGALTRVAQASGSTWGLLAGSALVTAFPLVCFASAASRLPFAAVGIFQYLAPSLSLVLAVLLYGEPFGPAHALTFALIWLGLALYTWDGFRPRRA